MMNDIISKLPKMKAGQQLMNEILALPEYKKDICNKSEAERLLALSDLYDIYIPTQMTQEIYSKLYSALLHSLKSKGTKLATKQHNENFKACKQLSYSGIMGGLDSFTIIGCSGIGKSTTISKVISHITENKIIELEKPFARILPCLIVQCPFDSSVKGLLLEILRKTDEYLGSKYYHDAIRTRATTDMLIGSVSQVALNHIGILVVDEIQNVVNSKHGKSLVGMLTQLINNSGISICMVGTPESKLFFESQMQLARRSIGLQYSKLAYNQDFCTMCDILYSYQYTKTRVNITDDIRYWLYEHSNGIVSSVISLIHDAQELAIINGTEKLSISVLNEAYKQRLSLMHNFTETTTVKRARLEKTPTIQGNTIGYHKTQSITELSEMAKNSNIDIVSLLQEEFEVLEVKI